MGESKLYKIGELAKLSMLSSRTIDYYTKIGLIHPETRSDANYRYYNVETVARLKRIEILKSEKYSLEEIKKTLDQFDKVTHSDQVTDKLTALQIHLFQLEKDVQEISPMIKHLKPSQAKSLLKVITPQSIACIEGLLILLGKNPLL